MGNKLEDILNLTRAELEHQDCLREENPDFREVDDASSLNDFIAYAIAYLGRASTKMHRNHRDGYTAENRRDMLVKAAGLCLRAAERHT
jgi:hypothetical protein